MLADWCICYRSCDAHGASCSPQVMALPTLRAHYSLRYPRRFPSLFNWGLVRRWSWKRQVNKALSDEARSLTAKFLGTAYLNCEVRIFKFSEQSTIDDAHLFECEQSKKARARPVERDPSVLAEHDAISGKESI